MGRFIRHTRCDNCGSSDANAVYEDGSTHCFSCENNTWPDGRREVDTQAYAETKGSFVEGECRALSNRSINQATCEFWGYQIGNHNGSVCHIANYRDQKGRLVAQKIRKANKKFQVIGQGKDMPLYGQWLWNGGKSIVITEGEIDALSVSQAFDNRYAVVSLPAGAQSAVKAIQQAYEWLDGFEKIVLCFDNDEPGQKAAEEVAAILPAGKAHIMTLPSKDANQALLDYGPGVITKAFWNARQWRPDGVVAVSELRAEVLNPEPIEIVPFPWQGLNDKLKGIRKSQLITLTSGSGLGKSTAAREFAYDLVMNKGKTVGMMFLEEDTAETTQYLMGIYLNKNIVDIPECASMDEKTTAFDVIEKKPIFLWDHFGSQDIDTVLAKVRYMVKVLGVQYVFLDHLSILVSGIETNDERKTIDVGVTKLRSLIQETGVTIIMISHLKKPSGDKGHEDGEPVRSNQLRGSHSIFQLSDVVIGFQKNPEDPHGDDLEMVVLKARKGGRKGPAGNLKYDYQTGRLTEGYF